MCSRVISGTIRFKHRAVFWREFNLTHAVSQWQLLLLCRTVLPLLEEDAEAGLARALGAGDLQANICL